MSTPKTTPKQRRLTRTLAFIAAYDGGPASNVKAKLNGRRRVKRRSARLGRIEASRVIDEATNEATAKDPSDRDGEPTSQ